MFLGGEGEGEEEGKGMWSATVTVRLVGFRVSLVVQLRNHNGLLRGDRRRGFISHRSASSKKRDSEYLTSFSYSFFLAILGRWGKIATGLGAKVQGEGFAVFLVVAYPNKMCYLSLPRVWLSTPTEFHVDGDWLLGQFSDEEK